MSLSAKDKLALPTYIDSQILISSSGISGNYRCVGKYSYLEDNGASSFPC